MSLAALLHDAGLTVNEIGDWRNRQRPGGFGPVGVIVHHTAGTKSLNVIVNGRSDLPGPLANLHMPKDGTVNLVSDGRCNHAGTGAQKVLDRVRHDLAPLGTAAACGYIDGPVGNGLFYGIEAENLGDGRDPWPLEQVNSVAQACAALCRNHGWTENRVIGHLEWTRRKIDPRGFLMGALRHLVAQHLKPPHDPRSTVYDPPFQIPFDIVSSLKAPGGGVWVLTKDGRIYAFHAPDHGAPFGHSYWIGRTARELTPNGDGYTVVTTSNENYSYP